MKRIEATINYCDQSGDEEVEYTIEGVLSPIDMGCTNGPPESCYPPEGGDLLSWTVYQDGETTVKAGDLHNRISEEPLFSDIQELLLEAAED
jgi:hypothetical protein